MAASERVNGYESTSTHTSGACDGGDIDDCALGLYQVWRCKMDEHQRPTHVSIEHLVKTREVTAAGVALCVNAAHTHSLDVVEVRSAGCIHLSK